MATHYPGAQSEVLALDAFIKLTRAAEAVNTTVNLHLKAYDLTTSQFGVLDALYHLGAMHTGQLGEKILKSSGNMTLVVDNLEKRGLVSRQRKPDDRRCIEIHLTTSGRELIEQIMPRHVRRVVIALNVLSPLEQRQLADLSRKLGLGQARLRGY